MYSWWKDDSGNNMLRGTDSFNEETYRWEPNRSDPCKLPRSSIIDFLRRIPQARLSFDRDYARLDWSEAEKQRIDEISTAAARMLVDIKTNEDAFQNRWNTAGIYTTGPKGGSRRGGR